MRKKSLLVFSVFAAMNTLLHANDFSGTLKKIAESKSITIGHREASLPFSYLDESAKPIGYSMDLCMKVVDAVKKELKMPELAIKLVPVTSQTRIPLVSNGTVDIECGSTTNSKERGRQVAFSLTHFVIGVRTLTRSNSGIKSIEDFDGRPIVTTTGTTCDKLIKQAEVSKKIDTKNLYGKDHAESFLMVETGRADAFVMDDILLSGLIANARNPKEWSIVGPILQTEPYGLMFRKDDPAFKTLVDDTLKGLMKSGEFEKIYHKWFMSPIAPKNINVNVPMSDKLKELIKNPSDVGI